MIRTIRRSTAVLAVTIAAVAAVAVVACNNDTINRPFSSTAVDPLFERYVSMGNSITAGFQSGGILDSTQQQSYAVLLAHAMRSAFFTPSLDSSGCPPPYTNVFTQTRYKKRAADPPSTASTCFFRRIRSNPPPYISNTAVPGAAVMDILNNLDTASNANTLTQLILGGLTQAQMMERAHPTFVSIWIGNNDVLGAATSSPNAGDSTQITSVANFQARYGAMLDTVEAAGPRGAILIGVANVTAIPFFSQGATYWAIKNGLGPPGVVFPPAFTVSSNCAPIVTGIPGARGDSTLVPFPYGLALLGAAAAGAPRNLDCGDTVAAVVVPKELVKLVTTVGAYNTFISAQATAHGWAYLDPNMTLDSLRAIPTQVAPLPNFGAPPNFTACAASPFGLAFSCDGVHPSAATHRLIAKKLRDAINAAYTTDIPPIP